MQEARSHELCGGALVTNPSGLCPVGGKRPSALGLYDLLGNGVEWTADWYGAYPTASVTVAPALVVNPTGPATGTTRVLRGVRLWTDHPLFPVGGPTTVRLGARIPAAPTNGSDFNAFRLVRTLP